jgi:hypothetical protein
MNTKTTPKDFFLHLGATVTLYVATVALINLAFEIVNRSLPDALQVFYGIESIVWPMSMIIVLAPVLYVLEWLTDRDIMRMPEKAGIWIRKWRIYLTLFLTAAMIIGDLITLLSTYFNGEITSRFIYKVIIVLIVSAVIFIYYLLKRIENLATKNKWQSILAWAGVVIIVASIVGGFIIIGSPAKQRAIRFDAQRIGDLSDIQYRVVNYWQKGGKLPQTIKDLNDPISNFTIPVDPETKMPYEYSVLPQSSKSPWTFELCATFNLPSDLSNGGLQDMNYRAGKYGVIDDENWSHGVGRTCFERIVDTVMHPPLQQNPNIM